MGDQEEMCIKILWCSDVVNGVDGVVKPLGCQRLRCKNVTGHYDLSLMFSPEISKNLNPQPNPK